MEISKWNVHVETEQGTFDRRHFQPGLVSASVVLAGLDSRPPMRVAWSSQRVVEIL
jgi:hypothetical protein